MVGFNPLSYRGKLNSKSSIRRGTRALHMEVLFGQTQCCLPGVWANSCRQSTGHFERNWLFFFFFFSRLYSHLIVSLSISLKERRFSALKWQRKGYSCQGDTYKWVGSECCCCFFVVFFPNSTTRWEIIRWFGGSLGRNVAFLTADSCVHCRFHSHITLHL